MKEVVIVGAGMGPESLSAEGRDALTNAEVWFGAERLLKLYASVKGGKQAFPYYRGKAILDEIERSSARSFAVLVSGDSAFYSAASSLVKELSAYKPSVVAGISSISVFFSRLGKSWEHAAILSAHGRDIKASAGEFVSLVRRNRETFCLADSKSAALGEALIGAGLASIKIHVGENLGSADEKIYTIDGEALSRAGLPELSVLLAVNETPDDRVLHGIPDDLFTRAEGIPMTKSAIRSLILSRLALRSREIVWDIGAGTGSVAVEAALAAWRGQVFAVERETAAQDLIRENCRRFHIANISVVPGEAPGVLAELPKPDAVFIGGSGGIENLKGIIAAVREKNPGARITASAVTIETAAALLAALPGASLIQVSAAEGKKAGSSRLLIAQNPVMIISRAGDEE